MRDILRKAKPQRLDDLIALNALYRPGPAAQRHGRRLHRAQAGQDRGQVRAAGARAGARRHLRRHRLSGTGDAHLERASPASRSARPTCCARRWARRTPRSWRRCAASSSRARRRTASTRRRPAHIFDLMEHFAGYGFNKSHSTAYAFLAYQTAYLKANYPVALRRGAADHRGAEHRQARAVSRRVPRPRHSGAAARHQREPAAVHRRAGQGRPLRPDGDQERRRRRDRVAARACAQKQGRITSLHALCEDLDLRLVNKRVFESLVKAGAFDSLVAGDAAIAALPSRGAAAAAAGGDRRGLRARRAASARPRRRAGAAVRRRSSDGARRRRRADAHAAARGDAVDRDRAARLREGNARPLLERPSGRSLRRGAEGVRRADDRASSPTRAGRRPRDDAWGPGGRKPIEPDTSIGGIVAACRQLKTRKGDRMAVFTLEDAQGGVEVIAFPETYQRARQPDRDRHAGARPRQARTRRRVGADPGVGDRAARQRARAAGARSGDPADACRPTAATFEALGEIFSRHRGDRRVSFEIELPATRRPPLRVARRRVSSQIRVRPSPALIAEVEQIVGRARYRVDDRWPCDLA